MTDINGILVTALVLQTSFPVRKEHDCDVCIAQYVTRQEIIYLQWRNIYPSIYNNNISLKADECTVCIALSGEYTITFTSIMEHMQA